MSWSPGAWCARAGRNWRTSWKPRATTGSASPRPRRPSNRSREEGIMSETVDVTRDTYTEKYGFHDTEQSVFKSRKGLDHDIVEQISRLKGEPEWMRLRRHE